MSKYCLCGKKLNKSIGISEYFACNCAFSYVDMRPVYVAFTINNDRIVYLFDSKYTSTKMVIYRNCDYSNYNKKNIILNYHIDINSKNYQSVINRITNLAAFL